MTRTLLPVATCLAVLGAMALPGVAHAQGRLIWSGDVDDTAVVSLHGRDVQTRTISGKSVSSSDAQVFGRLPDQPVFVTLRKRGRGRVHIVQQPAPFNNFTTVVRIKDPQPGAGHYRFILNW